MRGLLVYVATLHAERRTMAELRRIATASEDDLAATLADIAAAPEAGQRIPARAAAAHLNRPERERGSVLSTVVRHTAWLDDPRLCAALARSDFSMADLKRQPMTVCLAIPPDRLRACLGFVRGYIGLALDGVTAAPGKPVHRVAFFLDEFGQLGRMDRLAESLLAKPRSNSSARSISILPATCRARSASKPSATRRRTSPNRAAPGASPAARPAAAGSICRAVRC